MKGMNNICSINQKWVREPSLDPTWYKKYGVGKLLDRIIGH